MIGLLGGTFDPIHNGHLLTAQDLLDSLGLEQIRFIPCGTPPHRDLPVASAEQRLAMLQAAVAGEPRFVVDDREIKRSGPSYMVETLKSFREELGDKPPLGLILGMDAFLGLESWHEWQSLVQLAHLIVMTRPGYERKTKLSSGLQALVDGHENVDIEVCNKRGSGCVIFCTVTNVDVSSTLIRQRLQSEEDVSVMLPGCVYDMIRQEKIYCR